MWTGVHQVREFFFFNFNKLKIYTVFILLEARRLIEARPPPF